MLTQEVAVEVDLTTAAFYDAVDVEKDAAMDVGGGAVVADVADGAVGAVGAVGADNVDIAVDDEGVDELDAAKDAAKDAADDEAACWGDGVVVVVDALGANADDVMVHQAVGGDGMIVSQLKVNAADDGIENEKAMAHVANVANVVHG